MNHSIKLGLIGMLLNSLGKVNLTQEENQRLLSFLDRMGIGTVDKDNLLQQLHGNISVIAQELDYFDSSELQVNEPLDKYLIDVSNQIANSNYVRPRDVAMVIVSLGNKPGDNDQEDGVKALLEMAWSILNRYEELPPGEIPDQSDEVYCADARRLEYILRILGQVDLFVTARFGMIAGVEEYAPLPYATVHPLETFDIVGFECGLTADCKCGCAVDHSEKMLAGLEAFISGDTDSSDYHYLEGVNKARGVYLADVSGTEGKVFDALKALGKAAYEASKEAWDNLVSMFDESDDEADKNVTNVADDNKKAIQSMKDKAAEINDKAKAGIAALAEKVDPSGAMGKIVANLTGPSSAGGVIDGLLGLMGTNSAVSKELNDKKKAAETALSDLKKATDGISGDDSNKEAAATARAALNEKIAGAREAVADAKKEAQEHNKITKGIRKAIKGITPHIFITKGGDDDNKDNKDKK